jgi:hypothetical protein
MAASEPLLRLPPLLVLAASAGATAVTTLVRCGESTTSCPAAADCCAQPDSPSGFGCRASNSPNVTGDSVAGGVCCIQQQGSSSSPAAEAGAAAAGALAASLTLALTQAVDNCAVGLSYRLRGRPLGVLANAAIALINGAGTLLAATAGEALARVLPAAAGGIMGGGILLLLGTQAGLSAAGVCGGGGGGGGCCQWYGRGGGGGRRSYGVCAAGSRGAAWPVVARCRRCRRREAAGYRVSSSSSDQQQHRRSGITLAAGSLGSAPLGPGPADAAEEAALAAPADGGADHRPDSAIHRGVEVATAIGGGGGGGGEGGVGGAEVLLLALGLTFTNIAGGLAGVRTTTPPPRPHRIHSNILQQYEYPSSLVVVAGQGLARLPPLVLALLSLGASMALLAAGDAAAQLLRRTGRRLSRRRRRRGAGPARGDGGMISDDGAADGHGAGVQLVAALVLAALGLYEILAAVLP